MITTTIGAVTGVIVLLVTTMVLLLSAICIIRKIKKREKLLPTGNAGLNNAIYEGE